MWKQKRGIRTASILFPCSQLHLLSYLIENVFGECYFPCMLKTSVVDFRKEKAHCNRYKRLNISSLDTQLSILPQKKSKGCNAIITSLLHFCIVLRYNVLFNRSFSFSFNQQLLAHDDTVTTLQIEPKSHEMLYL